MADTPKDRRPKAFPPPEFPPRKPPLFARTPPAIFPPILGLLGLGLALRRTLEGQAAGGVAEVAIGALVGFWLLALLAMATKVARRSGAFLEDFKVLPGRAGLAALSVSGMAVAALLVPYAPGLALVLAFFFLALHAAFAVLLIRTLVQMPPEAREVNPAWHLAFVGFIVAAVPLHLLGWSATTAAILWLTIPVAGTIWAISAWQLVKRVPPGPLRPLLAIHLAPAALFTTVASLTGHAGLAHGFAAFASLIFILLVLSARWIIAAGFSPMWGALTFPLATYATALLVMGSSWAIAGKLLTVLAALFIPIVAWKILKLWPGNRLAQKTNAAQA